MKKHNFSAGPSILAPDVIDASLKAIKDFDSLGLSLLEISHRTPPFERVLNETIELFKELLNIPKGYSIFFLGGGASSQFYMVPFNLMETKAGYVNTGVWATKAIKEGRGFGEAVCIASSEDKNFSYIPKGYDIPIDLDYLHITTNNTIYGTAFHTDIESPVPLIADMSSDILSREIDISKYGLIYGGAQKNVGAAGVTFVIVKEELLGKVTRHIPSMIDYRNHIANDSMFNTPPVFSIFTVRETLKWVKKQGGVKELYKINLEKANILYEAIDSSKKFCNVINKEDRSIMNVSFVLKPEFETLFTDFLSFAEVNNIVGIKGHKLSGGFRASIYNAMPIESVRELVRVLKEFDKK